MIRTLSVGVPLEPVAVLDDRPLTRSGRGADTLMFVVNYGNGNGFIFVSNDDRDGEILMYAENGNFTMQDTAGNPGLKMHVEMMLAYQKHKLYEIRTAEANGEEYLGGMLIDEIPISDYPPEMSASADNSGMPGAHICNITGMPGSQTRPYICAPSVYEYKDWNGNEEAIAAARRRYPNQKCFGVPVIPPEIDFPTLGVPGVDQPCATPPYCNPPIFNYDSYYLHYGCFMELRLNTSNTVKTELDPLLTTCWDQKAPLKHGNYAAGCGPIALVQILLYHSMPETYNFNGSKQQTKIDELRKLRTNADIAASLYVNDAWKLIEEIRRRMQAEYLENLSTSTTINAFIPTFRSFGYTVDGGIKDYYDNINFDRTVESILQKRPVLMFGRTADSGHFWVLDGYKKQANRYNYATYYFDEYGRFNEEKRYTGYSRDNEFVHVNYGWGEGDLFWVERGVYVFNNTNYDHRLSIITGIRPL